MSFRLEGASGLYTPPGGTTPVGIATALNVAGFMPESFGALADGVTDDMGAINAAATAAFTAGGKLLLTPGKTYYTSGGLLMKCHVDGYGAFIEAPLDFNGTTISIGDASAYTSDKIMYLPRVRKNKTNYNNWNADSSSIGIYVQNIENCELHFAGVRNNAVGVWITATAGKGTSYNKFYLGYHVDNKVQFRLEPVSVTGWVNQNEFHGGRIQISSGAGTNVPFTRDVLMKTWATAGAITTPAASMSIDSGTKVITYAGGDFTALGFYKGAWVTMTGWVAGGDNIVARVETIGTTTLTLAANTAGLVTEGPTASVTVNTEGAPFGYVVNNNSFFGTSFESDAAEALVDIKGGMLNNFYGCRFEQTTNTSIFFHAMGTLAPTKYNGIYGGYTNSGTDFVANCGTSNSTSNTIQVGDRMAHGAANTFGWLQMSNYGSDTYPVATIWGNAATDAGIIKPAGTTWMGQVGAYYWKLKKAADAQSRLEFNSQTGRIYFGDGTIAIGGAGILGSYLEPVSGAKGVKQVSNSHLGGGLILNSPDAEATLSGATTTITFSIPVGARLQSVQLRVDTAITSGDGATSWAAAFSGGSTTAIVTGQAFTKNTKAGVVLAGNEITTNTTNIVISANSGTFSGGVIHATPFFYTLDTLANAP